jgi:hypothetical protein
MKGYQTRIKSLSRMEEQIKTEELIRMEDPIRRWASREESGLLLPEEPETIPERTYGPLEIKNEADRNGCYRALNQILDLSSVRGGAFRYDDASVCEERKTLVMALAKVLLGSDVEFAELC